VNGLRLHYLDWGGSGNALLLLAGADDAHIFDTFAPKFVDRWRVVALTRRGFGESDKALGRYDRPTLIDDLRQFLDALKIDRIDMVAHSMAADELTLFASRYSTRVGKVVYLDPSPDDREGDLKSLLTLPGLPPAQKKFALEVLGLPDAANVSVPTLPANFQAQVEFVRAGLKFPVDYSGIHASTIAFFAGPPDEASRRTTIEHMRSQLLHVQIVEMKNAPHYLFLGATQDEVVRRVREFLSQ
jgi:pimeloyl-ACP methyl ester carboxylesterase